MKVKIIKWSQIRKELIKKMELINKFEFRVSPKLQKRMAKATMYPACAVMDNYKRKRPLIKNINDEETQKYWLTQMHPGMLNNHDVDSEMAYQFASHYQCSECKEYLWGEDLFEVKYVGSYEDWENEDGKKCYAPMLGVFCRKHIPRDNTFGLKKLNLIAFGKEKNE